jgi:hypothetical protein
MASMKNDAAVAEEGGDETFVGPQIGGGRRGTIVNGQLEYRGVGYPITNGQVTFPDCRQYMVALHGALFGGSGPMTRRAPTRGSTSTPQCS